MSSRPAIARTPVGRERLDRLAAPRRRGRAGPSPLLAARMTAIASAGVGLDRLGELARADAALPLGERRAGAGAPRPAPAGAGRRRRRRRAGARPRRPPRSRRPWLAATASFGYRGGRLMRRLRRPPGAPWRQQCRASAPAADVQHRSHRQIGRACDQRPGLAPRRRQSPAARAPRRSAHRLVAPERRERVEDPRRDGGPGDRDPDRLVDVLRLHPEALDDRAERPPRRARASNGSAAAQRLAAPPRASARASGSITFSQAFGSSTGSANRNRISGQTSASVCALSWTIAQAARRRSRLGGGERLGRPRARSAEMLGEAPLVLARAAARA